MGSLYLHCDQYASHRLRLLLDGVFGSTRFENEVAWCYAPSGRGPKHGFHRKHDMILYYRKGRAAVFNRPYTPMLAATRRTYNRVEADTGRRYSESPGRRRSYLDQQQGRPVPSWWTDIPSFGTATGAAERTGWPTQKPLALLERIIRASSRG